MNFTEDDKYLLIAQLHRDEGSCKDKHGNHIAYLDSLGILTVGYGHNCEASPVPGVCGPGDVIPDSEANALFEHDLDSHIWAVRTAIPWIAGLDGARQGVLYNMSFNLGIKGLLGFRNTLRMVECGQYADAAAGMLNSKWARQVKGRATRLACQMRTGEWQ